MPVIQLLTPAQELDERIRLALRQLKLRLKSTTFASVYDDTEITQTQIDRARQLIFFGLGDWPSYPVTDPDWVSRFNQAIEIGNQELAAKIILGKEDTIDLTWPASILPTLAKYKIYYTDVVAGETYNGVSLQLNLGQGFAPSPIEITPEQLTSAEAPNVHLYGATFGIPYKFVVTEVGSDGIESAPKKVARNVIIHWEKPYGEKIKKYELHYKTTLLSDDYNGTCLQLTETSEGIASPLIISAPETTMLSSIMMKLHTTIMNVPFFVKVYAITEQDARIEIPVVTVTTQEAPCKNEYCEIVISKDKERFTDGDRIKALLWYVNYVFFLREKNYWAAYHMVEERKRQNTVFPTSMPWYFMPLPKGTWEMQSMAKDNQYVTFIEQELNISIDVLTLSNKTVLGGTLKVNSSYIGEKISVFIEDGGGSANVILSVLAQGITERYLAIRTVGELAGQMQQSSIGHLDVNVNNANLPIKIVGQKTYSQRIEKFLIEQVKTFAVAYYEDFIAKPIGFTLDFGAERKIILENWQNDFELWKAIHKDIKSFLEDLILLNPLYYINDISAILQTSFRQELLDIGNLGKTGILPEKDMDRIVAMLSEDDTIASDFSSYMTKVADYINAVPLTTKETTLKQTTDEAKVLETRERALDGQSMGETLNGTKLPYKWDLQRFALARLQNADLWREIADFNLIANPLDEMEVYPGRLIIMPSMPSDRVRNPHQI